MGSKQNRLGRGRLSRIDFLPEDIRIKLNAGLREKRLTQIQIIEALNPLLEERGEKPISKSSMNRYALKVEKQGAMMREAREAADAIVGNLSEQKGTDLGRATAEMIKTVTFDKIMNDGDLEVDEINKLALICQRIERASKISLEREAQLRQQILEQAADEIEETAIQMGNDAETAQFWREKILGIK